MFKECIWECLCIFLNSDFSVDIGAISVKLLGNVLYSLLEGPMS